MKKKWIEMRNTKAISEEKPDKKQKNYPNGNPEPIRPQKDWWKRWTKRGGSRLWLYFTGIIFLTMLFVFVIVTLAWFLLFGLNVLPVDPFFKHIPILVYSCGSGLLGAIITLFVGKLIIRPMQNFSNAFDELSKGNWDVKMPTNERIVEIREMTKHFNSMTYDLSHIETLRSDFVSNVSHEFKTPLAAIEGYATLLQNPNLSPEKHAHYVEKILENSKRLSSLSSNILALSKLENQEIIVDNKEFRLDEQIRRTILMLESSWSAKEIEFDMDLPKQMYWGSESLLEQVWGNILHNAIKHSPVGGVIHVNIAQTETDLIVSIADHGDGMSEEVQKHIFEKFYQGDSSHKAEGNGLGLALVKRIVELSRGNVTVKSQVGEGAVFSVSLPL